MMNEVNPASLLKTISLLREDELPPVHLWNPPICKNVFMRIAQDGRWYYMDSPIGRERMVKLFSRVLRYDDDGHYYLVTPIEKIRLIVDDKPFTIINFEIKNPGLKQKIFFETNTSDFFLLDKKHPLRVVNNSKNEPSPYILIRSNLEGRITRNIFYKLVDISLTKKINGKSTIGIWSDNSFFSLEGK